MAELENSVVELISIEAAQPNLDLSVLAKLPSKTMVVGVLDLEDANIETPEDVAVRIREGLKYRRLNNRYWPRTAAWNTYAARQRLANCRPWCKGWRCLERSCGDLGLICLIAPDNATVIPADAGIQETKAAFVPSWQICLRTKGVERGMSAVLPQGKRFFAQQEGASRLIGTPLLTFHLKTNRDSTVISSRHYRLEERIGL